MDASASRPCWRALIHGCTARSVTLRYSPAGDVEGEEELPPGEDERLLQQSWDVAREEVSLHVRDVSTARFVAAAVAAAVADLTCARLGRATLRLDRHPPRVDKALHAVLCDVVAGAVVYDKGCADDLADAWGFSRLPDGRVLWTRPVSAGLSMY